MLMCALQKIQTTQLLNMPVNVISKKQESEEKLSFSQMSGKWGNALKTMARFLKLTTKKNGVLLTMIVILIKMAIQRRPAS